MVNLKGLSCVLPSSDTLMSILMKKLIPFFCITIAFIGTLDLAAQQSSKVIPEFRKVETPWADSVLLSMTLEQKIGQLFMVAAYSNRDQEHIDEIKGLIENEHIGGLIFMQGGPIRQANLTNYYQEISTTPLLLSMDAEWGLGMRLDSVPFFPRQMTLGATYDDDLVYDFGRLQGKQLRRMGVHVSFSPVVDINSNAANPVIGNRSFGELREQVAKLGEAYMKGLQDEHVLANAKHFPGHGDTDKDSHKTLPSILHTRARLDSIELYPFEQLIQHGVGSMMVAHLEVPALDPAPGIPTTLSPKVVTDLLRNEMGFDGLVFTDALNMRGVADIAEPGDAEFRSLIAGNDVLLFAGDVPLAIERILKGIEKSEISVGQIDEHCYRILQAKEWCGLNDLTPVKTQGLIADLNNSEAKSIQRRLVESSLTVLKNDGSLPIKESAPGSVAVLSIGTEVQTPFNDRFSSLIAADYFSLPKNPDFNTSQKMESRLAEYDLVIVNFLSASNRPSENFGVSNQSVRIVNAINSKTKVVINLFTNPYALKQMRGIEKAECILVAYQDDSLTQTICAEALAAGAFALGRLPVTASVHFPVGLGLPLSTLTRLRHTYPEFVGLDTRDLVRIDSIAQNGIQEQAYPGCRVLVIKNESIIIDRSYGHLTYENKDPVTRKTVYDLASITKIVASTAALMRLYDEGEINLNYSLCDYVALPDTAACYNVNLREMMSHYAQLPAWIPFYLETMNSGKIRPELYREQAVSGFSTLVADDLYIKDSYVDSIYAAIAGAALRSKKEYKYSDLGYYYVKSMIESISGVPLERYVDSVFYQPMGLPSMGYLPLNKMQKDIIAPTEYDLIYRKQLIHGHVHDPGAAMMGGVGGHAGVFSTAEDLGIMMYMFMNKGTYGGVQYVKKSTLDEFTSCQFCDEGNRRAIGFDKPSLEKNSGPTCNAASALSFGHSGFTGTLAWADPKEDLVYVFLSNRVYPNADNTKLLKMDIRTDIQEVIYDAIRKSKLRQNHDLLGVSGEN
jgi:beta-N-acetylhexosaminidase